VDSNDTTSAKSVIVFHHNSSTYRKLRNKTIVERGWKYVTGGVLQLLKLSKILRKYIQTP
jgi:hypothetical protein